METEEVSPAELRFALLSMMAHAATDLGRLELLASEYAEISSPQEELEFARNEWRRHLDGSPEDFIRFFWPEEWDEGEKINMWQLLRLRHFADNFDYDGENNA